ncbi:hypothetical protein [Brevundimonas sp. FT23028]|uniref:hypothetical protein n=1 Tax=Brevundimonas sp. FT23028 TaxID=3393748 RepID=UPI003B588AE3
MADFAVANADFQRQCDILDNLFDIVDVTAKQDGQTRYAVESNLLPLVAAGGQNTMAACGVVLIAAHFEECVRQQVEEYAKSLVASYGDIEEPLQAKMIDAYWKAGLSKLSRLRPKDDPAWAGLASTSLSSMLKFPVSGDDSHLVASWLCEHENNMRMDTVLLLTGRVGIKDLAGKLSKSAALKAVVGALKKDDFAVSLRVKLKEFYDLRNGVVHSISQNSGIGRTVFAQWAVFLRAFSTALSEAMVAALGEYEADLAKRKAKAAAKALTAA